MQPHSRGDCKRHYILLYIIWRVLLREFSTQGMIGHSHDSLLFFFKCNRTIGSRSIGHRVWSNTLTELSVNYLLNEKHNSAEPSAHSDAVF